MADEGRQRHLRDWAEGDSEWRARFLAERLREGLLSEERLRLIAYLGEESARDVLPPEPPPGWLARRLPGLFGAKTSDYAGYPEEWAYGLSAFGTEVLLRAYLAVSHTALPPLPPGPVSEYVEAIVLRDQQALGLLEEWLLNYERGMPPELDRLVNLRFPDWEFGVPSHSPLDLFVNSGHPDHDAGDMSLQLSSFTHSPEQRSAIHAELVPWVLGLRDPLAERVAARGVEAD